MPTQRHSRNASREHGSENVLRRKEEAIALRKFPEDLPVWIARLVNSSALDKDQYPSLSPIQRLYVFLACCDAEGNVESYKPTMKMVLRLVASVLVFSMFYALFDYLSAEVVLNYTISPFFLAAGLKSLFLILAGPFFSVFCVIAVGCSTLFYLNSLFNTDAVAYIAWPFGKILLYNLYIWFVMYVVKSDLRLRQTVGTVVFLFVVSAGHALVGCLFLGLMAADTDVYDPSAGDFVVDTLSFVLGDAAGLLVVLVPSLLALPTLYTAGRNIRCRFSVKQSFAALLSILLCIIAVAFALAGAAVINPPRPRLYITFLPVLHVAFNWGYFFSVAAAATLNVIVVIGLHLGSVETIALLELQLFMVILATTSIFLGQMIFQQRWFEERSVNLAISASAQLLEGISPSVLSHKRSVDGCVAQLMRVCDVAIREHELNTGKYLPRMHAVDLLSLLQTVLEVSGVKAEAKGLELGITTTMKSLKKRVVMCDIDAVSLIVSNMVDNAVKYTDQGSVILKFSVREEKKGDLRVSVEVTDTGRGIEVKDSGVDIFDPFVQVSRGIERTSGGFGLGLFISRKLASAMNGHLTYTSAGKDKGTTFKLTFLSTKGSYKEAKRRNDQQFLATTAQRVRLITSIGRETLTVYVCAPAHIVQAIRAIKGAKLVVIRTVEEIVTEKVVLSSGGTERAVVVADQHFWENNQSSISTLRRHVRVLSIGPDHSLAPKGSILLTFPVRVDALLYAVLTRRPKSCKGIGFTFAERKNSSASGKIMGSPSSSVSQSRRSSARRASHWVLSSEPRRSVRTPSGSQKSSRRSSHHPSDALVEPMQRRSFDGRVALIVEDSAVLQKLVARLVAKVVGRHYSVQVVQSAVHALNEISSNTGFVMTDIHMPEMSGIELCRLLRTKFPGVKVIALTADVSNDMAEKLKNAKVSECEFKVLA